MGRASNAKRIRRETRAWQATAIASHGHLGGERCLVCRGGDGGFTSREHPFPESLGNTEIVLPPGVVCDRCNNGPLSVLDQTICGFLPVKMRRTMLGVASKAGSVPTTKLSTGVVEHVGPAELRFTANGNKDLFRETFRDGDTVGFKFEFGGGRKLTPRYGSELSRALLKIALELAWIDHGEMMLEARFDHVRDAILDNPYDGFIVMGKVGDPDDVSVSLTYNFASTDDIWGMWVIAKLFGVTLATDSRMARPTVDLEEHAAVLLFTSADWKAKQPRCDDATPAH